MLSVILCYSNKYAGISKSEGLKKGTYHENNS